MTPQENDLITTLLSRLKNASAAAEGPGSRCADPPGDGRAAGRALLPSADRADPGSEPAYQAQNRIAELEKQLTDAQAQAARPAPTSFLGGLFGSRQPAARRNIPAGSVPAAGPWTRAPQVAAAPMAQPYPHSPSSSPTQPQPGYGPQAGGGGFMGGGSGAGGFLRSAAATAAGVAGGALLFQGISSLFGHSGGGFLGGQGMTPGLGETVVNNYYGSDGAGTGTGNQDTDAWGGGAAGGQGAGGDQDFSSAGLGGDQDTSSQDYGSGQDYGSDQDFSSSDFGGGDSNPC